MFIAALAIGLMANSPASEFFRWCDGLGLADDLRRPFGKIVAKNGRNSDSIGYGFLIGNGKDRFRVLMTDLSRCEFFKSVQPSREGNLVFVPADFRGYVRASLSPPPQGTGGIRYRYGIGLELRDSFSLYGEDPAMAWICHKKGFPDQSSAYFRRAVGTQSAKDLKRYVVDGAYCQVMFEIDETRFTWADMLRRMREFQHTFGSLAATPRLKAVEGMFAGMAEEERAHRPSPDRVTELIWQLRNESEDHAADSPTDRLVKIGAPAVPQLIDALRDRRFTRVRALDIGGWRGPFDEKYVLRVREFAKRALERIAHRSFEADDWRDWVTVEKSARAWWAEYQAVGEKALLLAALGKGGPDVVTQAARLAEAYPDVAFDPIVDCVRKSKNPDTRAYVVNALGRLPWSTVKGFLREVVATYPDFPPRWEAISIIANHELKEGVAAMEREWRRGPRVGIGSDNMVEFLIRSRQPSAVRTIAKSLPLLPPDKRRDVLFSLLGGPAAFYPFDSVKDDPATQKEFDREMEHLLAFELENRKRMPGMLVIGSEDLSDSELGYMAARALSEWFPRRYHFNPSNTASGREKVRQAALRVYRSHMQA